MTAPDLHRTISAVWRIESPRLVAALARITRDVGLAEDMAQDALVAALEEWPKSGVPDRPGAWLMTAAKRRAIDHKRHEDMRARKEEAIGRDMDARTLEGPDFDSALDDDIGDDLLRLIFTSCHPAISSEARTALTLRLLGGLTTDEIARAFLSSESTIAQRIVRAKRTIAEKKNSIRSAARDGVGRAARFRARSDLPRFQRRLHGDGWRRLVAARAV